MAHNFHSHTTHKTLQDFFLGYVCSLTEYNYGHHGSNRIWHHARELWVYITTFLQFFLSFVGNLSEIQPTNNPGITVIAVALT